MPVIFPIGRLLLRITQLNGFSSGIVVLPLQDEEYDVL